MSFDGVLDSLAHLRQRGELFIAVSPPFSVSFEIDRTVLRRTLEDQRISEAQFGDDVTEIGDMLMAILDNSVEQYISRRSTTHLDTSDTPGNEQDIRDRIRKVTTRLHDDHLQHRYNLKKSSKAPSFAGVDWDIKVKHFDANVESLVPFPYATFRLSFQKEFEDTPFAFFGGRIFDSVQVNLSVDEIDYLIRALHRAKERLEALEAQIGGHPQ